MIAASNNTHARALDAVDPSTSGWKFDIIPIEKPTNSTRVTKLIVGMYKSGAFTSPLADA